MPPKTPYKKGTYKGKVCYSRNNRNGQPYVTCNSNLEKPRKKAPSKKARVEKPKELYDIELLKILRSHRDANVISETQDKDIKALLKKIDKSIADRLQKNASEIAKIESSNDSHCAKSIPIDSMHSLGVGKKSNLLSNKGGHMKYTSRK